MTLEQLDIRREEEAEQGKRNLRYIYIYVEGEKDADVKAAID